jgi:hypothetical protein
MNPDPTGDEQGTPIGSVNQRFYLSRDDSEPPLASPLLFGRSSARTSNAAVAQADPRKTFVFQFPVLIAVSQ